VPTPLDVAAALTTPALQVIAPSARAGPAAVAAQQDRPPHGPDLRYDSVRYGLRRPAARSLITRPGREYVSRATVDRCHESCGSDDVWRP
jgi:hypothetical protein